MFLDDIKRKIKKEQKKGEHWDRFQYLDLIDEETGIDLIPSIRLLYVKNIGTQSVNIDVNKMKIRLMVGEEKYFPGNVGSQASFFVARPGGKLFIGQSLREHTSLPGLLIILPWILLVSLVGCGTPQSDTDTSIFKVKSRPPIRLSQTPSAPPSV